MNYIIENALNDLTRRINISSNLTHPSDKGATIGLFKILRDNAVIYDPNEIEIWALQNEWRPKGAKKLKEIALGIQEGRNLHGGKDSWAQDIFEQWKSEE